MLNKKSSVYIKQKKSVFNNYIDNKIAQYLLKKSRKKPFPKTHKMAIFAHDWICININQFGVYELEDLEFLFDFLTPISHKFTSGVAIDVGAHVGNHSLYFTNHFKHVFSHEPNPRVFDLLKFNTVDKPITPKNSGLGDKNGILNLFLSTEEAGSSSFIEGYHESMKSVDNLNHVEAKIETIDNLYKDLSNLSLIKIDAEGFESNVLNGAKETISRCIPIILIEQHEREFVNGSTPAISFLTEMGYTFFWFQKGIDSKNFFLRKICNIWELFVGKNHTILGNDIPPVRTYSMLICIPKSLQSYFH